MRILVISQHYWPEPITKATELAEGLADAGHEVTVLTGFPNYPGGALYSGYRLKPWSTEHINGVRVVRTYLLPARTKSTLRYMFNLASFALSASLFGPFLSGPVDVIYVRHPPLTQGLPTLVMKYLRRAPVVYAMHDLWPESIVEVGRITNKFVIGILDWFERFLMRRVEIVGLSSPGFVSNITGKGIPESKIRLLPDWVDERIYVGTEASPEVAEELGMTGRFNVVFAGNIGMAQDLDTVLDAAILVGTAAPDVQFVIVGDGVERERLEERASVESISNVKFVGPVTQERSSQILQCAQAALVHVRSGFLADISVPMKTYSYMASGKPVLMGAGTTSSELVERESFGLVFEPGNADSLMKAVVELVSMDASELARMGEMGRELFLSKYSREVGIKLHEGLFESLET
jgi:colanic acid biosynthesis glycosyl transferase WcaI